MRDSYELSEIFGIEKEDVQEVVTTVVNTVKEEADGVMSGVGVGAMASKDDYMLIKNLDGVQSVYGGEAMVDGLSITVPWRKGSVQCAEPSEAVADKKIMIALRIQNTKKMYLEDGNWYIHKDLRQVISYEEAKSLIRSCTESLKVVEMVEKPQTLDIKGESNLASWGEE